MNKIILSIISIDNFKIIIKIKNSKTKQLIIDNITCACGVTFNVPIFYSTDNISEYTFAADLLNTDFITFNFDYTNRNSFIANLSLIVTSTSISSYIFDLIVDHYNQFVDSTTILNSWKTSCNSNKAIVHYGW